MKASTLINISLKLIISILGVIIFFLYFFFEEKNDFSPSLSSNDDEKNRNTNFTKITNNLYNIYIAIVIIFLTILFFLPEGLIEKPELRHEPLKEEVLDNEEENIMLGIDQDINNS